MSNYQSFSTYQAPTQDTPQPSMRPRVDPDAGRTTSVVVRDGVATAQTSSTGRATTSELNPGFNSGTVFETARSMHGMGVMEIKADTLLTIDGVQAPAKFWENEGLIHKTAAGTYEEGSGEAQAAPEVAPQASTEDDLAMPPEVTSAVNQALEGVDDLCLAPLIASGIGIATGDLDRSTIVRQMVQFSGVSTEQAEARVTLMQTAFQHQADAAITARCGVAAADLADFYAWAKENHAGPLRGALEKQVHASDFSGYRALATRYLNDNPPSIEAVSAGGFEVRKHGATPEVKLEGQWMSIATAARLGML